MISFSAVRPVQPVRFGFWGGMGMPSTSSVDFSEAEIRQQHWAGFVPDSSIRSLFNTDKSPAAVLIDSDEKLDRLWQRLNLPDYDKPKGLDYRKQVILLVAREQATRTDGGIPAKLSFNRTDNKLTVSLFKNEPGKPGTAWYIGVLAADKGVTEPKELLAKPDGHRLSKDTQFNIYANT